MAGWVIWRERSDTLRCRRALSVVVSTRNTHDGEAGRRVGPHHEYKGQLYPRKKLIWILKSIRARQHHDVLFGAQSSASESVAATGKHRSTFVREKDRETGTNTVYDERAPTIRNECSDAWAGEIAGVFSVCIATTSLPHIRCSDASIPVVKLPTSLVWF